ncbi:MAG: T9SS type A sorting domain-containing protein [Bacteroidota bacterium]
MRRLVLLFASALMSASTAAQTPGSCEVGTAQAFLDVSDVQASLFNNGALFFGGSTTSGDGYLVPKVSGNSPIFAAGIWLSGTVNDDLRVSAARYGGYLFRPGPLNADGTPPDPFDCSPFDQIYLVSTYDVAIYDETGVASSGLAGWPVGLGAPAIDADGEPIQATNRDQTLNLAAGERPMLSGTQTAFWVMNDVGAPRLDRHTDPLSVEVQVTAFVTVDDVPAGARDASFYRFRILNRSANTIENARWSFFTDPDLGDAGDDYVGVDTTRSLSFVYNDSNEDGNYGSPPPAVGYDVLNLELAAGHTFIGGGPDGTSDPGTAEEYSNYMQGLWGNGTPIYEFGNGFDQPGNPTTTFFAAGDPVTESFYSEVNVDGNGTDAPQGDRRYVATAALGDLAPGDTATVDLAVLYGLGTDNLDSITELRAVSDRVQAAYDDGSLFRATEATPLLGVPELLGPSEASTFIEEAPITLSWTPVPDAEVYRVEQSASPMFEDAWIQWVDSTSARGALGVNDTTTYHWRVRAESPTRRGPFSIVRTYTSYVYWYIADVLRLEDGTPAYVEVSGPGGANPCVESARSRDGCDEVFGNLVYQSFNSTAEFYLSERGTGSIATIGTYAPNDFEIRFTDTGSLGFFRFQEGNVVRLPFEIWDIGAVAPGTPNDPADDVQMIPVLFADNQGACAFNVDEIPDGQGTTEGYVETDRIYAYYPSSSYADFEAEYSAAVEASPSGCFTPPDDPSPFTMGIRPIQRQVFGSSSDAPTLPATGTTIRFYTTNPRPVAEETSPRASDLTLGPAYPNPTASSLTVPYTLAQSSVVELALYDVLGRRVAELANARQPEGAHEATLDASPLAPGVYVIRLRAGDETRTARLTVVR